MGSKACLTQGPELKQSFCGFIFFTKSLEQRGCSPLLLERKQSLLKLPHKEIPPITVELLPSPCGLVHFHQASLVFEY